MPECIFLHFEQGLKLETFQDLDLEVENGRYVMTQFIQYKRNPDHFICWIRDSKGTVLSRLLYFKLFTLKLYGCQCAGFINAAY